jgi:uncharacterized protein (DUF1015 family)
MRCERGADLADVRPFRGIRYNQDAIGDISLVVAPPYDVIDDTGRDSYYNKHPYNIIRLILNRPKKAESPDEPYERAASFLDRWLAQRILIRDQAPGIYLYRQRYLLDSEYTECTGIIARVRVEDFSSGSILPHEDILPKPFEDRMKLLERTKANLDFVQALYSDPAERLKDPIIGETERFPIAQFQASDGVAHDLWQVTDERFCEKMRKFFSGRPLYIADGHHRYTTALTYARRLEESGSELPEDDPRRFIMMMIVEMENPGLAVLPVHRVVLSEAPDPERLRESVEQWFEVEEVSAPESALSGRVAHLLKTLKRSSDVTSFVAYSGDGKLLLLRLRPGVDVTQVIDGEASADYKTLDTTVLHRLVLQKGMGLGADGQSVERDLSFTRDALEAAEMVQSGRARMAFFVNSPKVEQVRAIADNGERMPQKSTYFYPKPCSGVVMNRIDSW